MTETAERSPAQMGRYKRNKGSNYEADLARYLRQWWPHAKRAVSAGWRSTGTTMADPGDLAGIPGVVVSAKNDERRANQDRAFAKWWADLDAMLADDPAALGVIVVKRPGHSDVAASWAHLHLSDLAALYSASYVETGHWNGGKGERDRTPVRIRLGDLVELLVAAGYARGAA